MASLQKDIDIQDKGLTTKDLQKDTDINKDRTLDKDFNRDRSLDKDINKDRTFDKDFDKDLNKDRDLDTDKNLDKDLDSDKDKDVTDENKEGQSTAGVIKDTVMQIGQKGVELGQKGVELVKGAYNVVAEKLSKNTDSEPVEHDESCKDKENCKGCSTKDKDIKERKHQESCSNQECEGCIGGLGPAALSTDPLGKDLQKQLGNGLDADMGTNKMVSDKGHGLRDQGIGNRDQIMGGDIRDRGLGDIRDRDLGGNIDQDLPKPIDRQEEIPSHLAGSHSYAGVVREQEQRLPSDIHADQLKDLGHGQRNVQI